MIWIRISDLKSLVKGTDFNSLRFLWSKWVMRIGSGSSQERVGLQLPANIYSLWYVNNTTENDASRSPNILGSSMSLPPPPATPFRFPQHTNAHPYLSATSFPGFSYYFPGRQEGTVEEGPGKDIDQPSELRINGPRTRVFFRVWLSLAWLLVNPSDGELARRLTKAIKLDIELSSWQNDWKEPLKVKESLSYHWKNGCTHFKKNSVKLDQNLLSMWASLILKTLIKEKPKWQASSKDCRILSRPGRYGTRSFRGCSPRFSSGTCTLPSVYCDAC